MGARAVKAHGRGKPLCPGEAGLLGGTDMYTDTLRNHSKVKTPEGEESTAFK